MNDQTKKVALEMRARGASYSAIHKELGVSKSTLSGWFSALPWSNEVTKVHLDANQIASRERMLRLNKVREIGSQFKYAQVHDQAKKEFKKYVRSPLFVAGLSIYWGEGDKGKTGKIRVSNTDPAMLRLYLRFLEDVCKVPRKKIRAWILAYPGSVAGDLQAFWSKNLDLKPEFFYKTTVVGGPGRGSRYQNGVCSLILTDILLKKKIIAWISLLESGISK